MGMPPFFSTEPAPSSSGDTQPRPPAPRPTHFTCRGTKQRGRYLLAWVHFDGVTTYDGEKLLVYETTAREFWARTEIDPHFMGDDASPVARFPPTARGADMANALVTALLRDGL